jgi:hypothetical protein
VNAGSTASRDLPRYRAVIAADIKDFTGNTDTDNRMLARMLPQTLDEAFARSGLDFSCALFPGQAGDGYVAGLPAEQLPFLIHPLLDHLQDVLTEQDAEVRARGRRGLRMRMRASIDVGPLPAGDPAEPDGIGKAMNDVHRLLDADFVRDALRDTDPDTTFLAAVISQRAYEDGIQSGHSALPASRLTPFHATVKQFTGDAWLYVPKPSGDALHRAFTYADTSPHAPLSPVPASDSAASLPAIPAMPNLIGHISGGQVVQGTIAGDVRYNAARTGCAGGDITRREHGSAPDMPPPPTSR